MEWLRRTRPQEAERLRAEALATRARIEGLRRHALPPSDPAAQRRGRWRRLADAAALPVALGGFAVNAVPYLTAQQWSRFFVRRQEKKAFVKFVVGAPAFLLWYAAAVAWLARRTSLRGGRRRGGAGTGERFHRAAHARAPAPLARRLAARRRPRGRAPRRRGAPPPRRPPRPLRGRAGSAPRRAHARGGAAGTTRRAAGRQPSAALRRSPLARPSSPFALDCAALAGTGLHRRRVREGRRRVATTPESLEFAATAATDAWARLKAFFAEHLT